MKFFLLNLSLFIASSAIAQEYHLDSIEVQSKYEEQMVEESVVKESKTLAKEAKGETLGDYLEQEQFIDSASYGPAVGRPVVKGMDGYRVGITNGNINLNDLSSMSQDHAVGVMPRATKKIEFLKGPASLLYGSYSGGVIRVFGEEHQKKLLKDGLRVDTTLSYGSNGAGKIGTATVEAADSNFSAYISTAYHQADSYRDGDNNLIKDSDTLSQQTHAVLGYKLNKSNIFKVYYDNLKKDYGIPNNTPESTTIDMKQERYGLVWHAKDLFDTLEFAQTEISYSEYLHHEYEGDSAMGLFGQNQLNISTAFGLDFDDWHVDTNLEYLNNELKVCHDHKAGVCDYFRVASRTSTSDNDGQAIVGPGGTTSEADNPDGLPFSHGHPMPNVDESIFKAGMAFKNFVNDTNEITLSARADVRNLTPNSENIQQEWLIPVSIDPNYYSAINDSAVSASLGWYNFLTDTVTMQTSLSYIQRLPSSTELFWNGFHHATNTYVMGDRYLENEESVNFDFDLMWSENGLTSEASFFYYNFSNYIYQTQIIGNDNEQINVLNIVGHNAYAWGMTGAGALVYGVALKESYKKEIESHKFEGSVALEAIRGELKDGSNIPRMPPFNASIKLKHKYHDYSSSLGYKYVDRSRFEGANEMRTPAYGWLSAYIEYAYKSKYIEGLVYLKGENLTDEMAYNHLSFLKDTAPLPGRQITAGLELSF
ncbi:MAG: TonB-dependent receptor [Campylobacterota bacterium]|nr:TonB-dependent receptor [Campylobacterota bacterium]